MTKGEFEKRNREYDECMEVYEGRMIDRERELEVKDEDLGIDGLWDELEAFVRGDYEK